MDIYDLSTPWQIQSQENSTQSHFNQVPGANVQIRTDNRLTQFIPPPSNIPWNVQGISWSLPSPQPSLMQFTGQMMDMTQPKYTPIVHAKRKPDVLDPNPEIPPVKQLITEEKMAAHLNSLHISSQSAAYSVNNNTEDTAVGERLCGGGLGSPDPQERLRTAQKIIFCEEMKKLRNEPLLPPSILERLEKPCMSLVLWKPQDNVLKSKEEQRKPSSKSEERTGVLVQNNIMDVEM